MDIEMPVMDGFTATQKIKASSDYANTPIIATTAKTPSELTESCEKMGIIFNSCLQKPFHFDELEEIILKHC
jgi:CheY-like chemotaxis protein